MFSLRPGVSGLLRLLLVALLGLFCLPFYTFINSMSRNLGTIFLQLVPKTNHDVNKNMIFNDKVGIMKNELTFLWILSKKQQEIIQIRLLMFKLI